jgi:hypothetical protein
VSEKPMELSEPGTHGAHVPSPLLARLLRAGAFLRE